MTRSASSRPSSRFSVSPQRAIVTAASLLAAVALVRTGWLEAVVGSVVDVAVANIVSLILSFTAIVTLLAWFLFDRRFPAAARWGVAGAIAAAVIAGLATLRVERVSGDLVPEFAWRWSPSRDRLLERVGGPKADAGGSHEPWAASSSDFPRFLGPAQMPSLDGPALDADWAARPPKRAWRRSIGAGWGGFAAVGGHAVTLEQRGDEEVIACYRVADGAPEWGVAVPARHETVLGGVGPRSTPTIRDGVVYATGATGWLHAIDGAGGKVLWRKNVVEDLGIDAEAHAAAVAWGRAGSPLVTESLVIVPGGGPRADGPVALVAYRRDDGSRAWIAGGSQIAYASPVLVEIDGREFVMNVNEAEVAGYDPAEGKLVWRFDWLGHSNSDANCSQAVLAGGRDVFVSKGYGTGAALFRLEPPAEAGAAWTVEPVWQRNGLLKTKFTNVAIHDGHAYGLSDGILECVRISDGGRAWKGGRYGQGQVLRVGDVLLVQAESGEVAAVECSPSRFRELGRFEAIRGQTWNNLCLTGDRLLVRNAEEAACYELSRAPSAAATAP